jgi:predicted MFS family arabinose efflux permease
MPPAFPVMAIFVLFMLAMAFRNVAYNTLTSKVPRPPERARFGSLQSSVQHLAAAIGAFAAAQFLTELPDHRLVGVDTAAYVSIGLSVCLVPLFWAVEHRVTRPDRVTS